MYLEKNSIITVGKLSTFNNVQLRKRIGSLTTKTLWRHKDQGALAFI